MNVTLSFGVQTTHMRPICTAHWRLKKPDGWAFEMVEISCAVEVGDALFLLRDRLRDRCVDR